MPHPNETEEQAEERCKKAFIEIRHVLLNNSITIGEAAEIALDMIVNIVLQANNGDQKAAAIDLKQGFMPDILHRMEMLKQEKYLEQSVETITDIAPLETFSVVGKKPN